jgi:GNAT superfamily N-acetyltransferase
MKLRRARASELRLLAEMNAGLIRDEGHGNPMTALQLQRRMRRWLRGDYRAVLFEVGQSVVGYALYRRDSEGVYLRQFFVWPDRRRAGTGREAVRLLREAVWPPGIRVTVEVLKHNRGGLAFWKAVGFEEYALTLASQDRAEEA